MAKPRKPLKRKIPLRAKKKPTAPKTDQQKRSGGDSTKPKKAKKTPVQRLEAEANSLMGRFIRGRGECWLAGKVPFVPKGVVQNCHLERRSRSKAIKFSPLNGVPGDMTGHVMLDNSQIEWGVVLNEHIPGRMERLSRMKRWALKNKGLFRIEDVLKEHIAFYSEMIAADVDWWEWHHSGMAESYIDPIEKAMDEVE